jgi:hypothetical protein
MELKKVLFRIMGKEFNKVSLITLLLSGIFVVSIFAATREGVKETVGSNPSLLGGGPDAYGYIWEDTDDDSIPYSWVPVDTTTWTEIVGLSDDDVQGPFSVGFDFPYYWYTVNQFWVGSNGYIAFQPGMLAQPFDSLPFPTAPNDILAVLMADILFGPTSTARAFYYTNGVDSLVVSFLDCPSWDDTNPNGVGSHTFQVVLNRADSTIHYNYGPQSGAFSNNETAIGIENVTGTVGLSYLNDMMPGSRLYHDSLTVKFTPPDSTTLVVEDVGIFHAMNVKSGGIFLLNAQSTAMWTKVKNFGNVSVGAFDVICVVRNPSNVIVFTDTITNPGMSAGQIDSVVFTPNWVPLGNGQHRAAFSTTLGSDINPNNNSITVETRVVTYPATLQYDDNLPEDQWSWAWTPGSEPGLGVYFQPPSYPVRIENIDIYVFAVGTSGYIARIFDDDGPNGLPGTILFEQLVNTPSPGPNVIDVTSSDITVTSGAFYVGWFQFDAGAASVGRDLTPPIARRSLENTGSWADFRNMQLEDLTLRATVGLPPGVEEGPVEKEIPSRIVLLQNSPNPFHGRTMIHFSLPEEGMTSLEIFDITGRHVRTLIEADKEPGNYRVEWNGRNSRGKEVSNGVYFYKLTSGDKSVTQKMVLLK